MKTGFNLTGILILILVITITASGCIGSEDKPQNMTDEYTIEEIPFASKLAIGENESIHILDVNDANILIEIEKTVENIDDPTGADMVFFADRLLIYNTEDEKITFERKFENGCDCSSGVFLEKGIAFITVSMLKDSFGDYTLDQIYNGKETTVASAAGSPDVFYNPQLTKLLDGKFAYSYYDPNSKEFGVNIVTQDFKVKEPIKMIDGSGCNFMRTSLYGDGDSYIYFYDKQGTGRFIIGDHSDTIRQFQLDENERINSYCLLDDRVLFSMNVLDQEGEETEKLILKNYNGEDIIGKNQETLYRMASNNEDIVIATDSYFKNHIIRINGNDEIAVHDLTVDDRLNVPLEGALDGTAVSIHHSSGNKFLLFFYGDELKLIKVEVN